MNRYKRKILTLSSLIGVVVLAIVLIVSQTMDKIPTYEVAQLESDITKFSGKLVVIDAGHGGYDDGSIGLDGILEKELTLTMSKKVRDILQKHNITVKMTRESDEVSWVSDNAEDLQARLDIASKAEASLMVSLHCNFSEEEPQYVRGSEIYANQEQKESLNLATSITEELKKLSPQLENRNIKFDPLHLTYFNVVPTIIVEMGFISNQDDLNYLQNEASQDKLAEKIAQGILNYLNQE